LHEEFVGHPRGPEIARSFSRACVEQLPPLDSRMGRAERSAETPLARTEHPPREIPDVDELRRAVGRAGREYFPSARDSVWPVREAAGRIVRADDEARADDERTRA